MRRGAVGHGGHRAGAHAVDRVAGGGLRQAGQQRGHAAEGQALVADLGGRGDGHLLDPLGRQVGVAAQQLADAVDDEVVGAGLGVDALLAGLAERGADPVDEHDLTQGAGHGWPPLEGVSERRLRPAPGGRCQCYSLSNNGCHHRGRRASRRGPRVGSRIRERPGGSGDGSPGGGRRDGTSRGRARDRLRGAPR